MSAAELIAGSGLPLDTGLLDGEWVSLAALAGERFNLAEGYFAAAAKAYPGLDRRGQAAFFVGGVSYYVAAVLAAYHLTGEALPAMGPEDFGVVTNASGLELRYRLADGAGKSDAAPGELMEEALAPLVARLKRETALAEGAQWRLCADSFASIFQSIGEQLGREAFAREEALRLLRESARMWNPQTGYISLELRQAERHFLKRGGCCRFYTAEGEGYCATCVLRSPEDQVAELRRAYAV